MGNCQPISENIQNKFESNECLLGSPTTEPTTFILREKMFSWGGDFDVKNDKGDVCYKIKGKVFTMRDLMTINDPEGNPLCIMKAKLLSCRPTYQLFKFTPSYEGQNSTDTEDGKELYRFAHI